MKVSKEGKILGLEWRPWQNRAFTLWVRRQDLWTHTDYVCE